MSSLPPSAVEYDADLKPYPYDPQKATELLAAAGYVAFAPDFYLPDFDLYIELTTMSQKLVTKKNRKVRRLKELYPDIQIKIFYQKDFRALCIKYGLAFSGGRGCSGVVGRVMR